MWPNSREFEHLLRISEERSDFPLDTSHQILHNFLRNFSLCRRPNFFESINRACFSSIFLEMPLNYCPVSFHRTLFREVLWILPFFDKIDFFRLEHLQCRRSVISGCQIRLKQKRIRMFSVDKQKSFFDAFLSVIFTVDCSRCEIRRTL